jgi:hypothetical protein
MTSNWATLLISTLIAVLFGEAFLKFAYTPPVLSAWMERQQHQGGTDRDWSFDQERFAFEPHQSLVVWTGEYRYSARIDDEGWRNPCSETQSPRFLVGDSFVFGLGLKDQATLQCQLSKVGVKVYAAGIPGANAYTYIKIIRKHGATLMRKSRLSSPSELILAIFMGNDFESLVDFDSDRHQGRPAHASLPARVVTRLNEFIVSAPFIRQSYITQMVKLVVGPRMKTLMSNTPEGVVEISSGSTFYARGTDEEEYVTRLDAFFEELKSEAERVGLEPITLLLIPDANEISVPRRAKAFAFQRVSTDSSDPQFKRSVLRKAAIRHGLGVIDGYDCLTSESFYYELDNHLRAAGSERLSECISAYYARPTQ